MSTWGDKLQKLSAEALNRLAAAEFDPKRVYQVCADRAALGFVSADIRPSIPVNVQECDAVKQLIAALAKEKVRHEWVPVLEGADVKYSVLRIDWEKRR